MPELINWKAKDVKPWRLERIKTITNCPLCNKSFEVKSPVVDHNHANGRIRDVLCSWCNSRLGMCENAALNARGQYTPLQWLKNVVNYIEHHNENPSDIQHHTYVDGKQKRKRRKKETIKTT